MTIFVYYRYDVAAFLLQRGFETGHPVRIPEFSWNISCWCIKNKTHLWYLTWNQFGDDSETIYDSLLILHIMGLHSLVDICLYPGNRNDTSQSPSSIIRLSDWGSLGFGIVYRMARTQRRSRSSMQQGRHLLQIES